jgi:hypothetical protein
MILGSGGITASPSLEEDDEHMVLGYQQPCSFVVEKKK